MNGQEIPDNIKSILNSMQTNNTQNTSNSSESKQNIDVNNPNNSNTNENTSSESNRNDTSNSHNNFSNIDMSTILKMQQLINSMHNQQDDSRTNLLMSLKPYLKESRKNKVDQYIQLMRMSKIFEIMNPLGGDNKNA